VVGGGEKRKKGALSGPSCKKKKKRTEDTYWIKEEGWGEKTSHSKDNGGVRRTGEDEEIKKKRGKVFSVKGTPGEVFYADGRTRSMGFEWDAKL